MTTGLFWLCLILLVIVYKLHKIEKYIRIIHNNQAIIYYEKKGTVPDEKTDS